MSGMMARIYHNKDHTKLAIVGEGEVWYTGPNMTGPDLAKFLNATLGWITTVIIEELTDEEMQDPKKYAYGEDFGN